MEATLSATTTCPKCGTHWPEDKPLPIHECPACGVVFAKFRAEQAEARRREDARAEIAAKEAARQAELAAKAERKAAAQAVEPAVTACAACGGTVAKAAKACPHCGAPGPKKASSPVVSFGIIFFGVLIVAAVVGQSDGGTSAQPASSLDTQEKRELAQTAVRLGGYRCDEVDALTPLISKPGVRINCNGYRYSYQLVDEGGHWRVRLD